mmetsp:Transcript_14916/g.34480  ORF Transcript_14916/g.34480 Transcript_14916/m.34480 type:complete len:151 (+) Transcript_14916:68-520(+)
MEDIDEWGDWLNDAYVWSAGDIIESTWKAPVIEEDKSEEEESLEAAMLRLDEDWGSIENEPAIVDSKMNSPEAEIYMQVPYSSDTTEAVEGEAQATDSPLLWPSMTGGNLDEQMLLSPTRANDGPINWNGVSEDDAEFRVGGDGGLFPST